MTDLCQKIEETDEPDKEIEEFWRTFKNSIKQFLTKEQKFEIDQLSNKLNKFKKEKQYYQIESYIEKHLEIVGYICMEQNNYYRANHLHTNIKRWIKITDKLTWDNKSCKKISDSTNVFNCLFSIYNRIYKKTIPLNGYKKEIIDLIIEYSKTKNEKMIHDLVNISIKNNLDVLIDKLKYIINLETYIKKGPDQKVFDNKVLEMKGRKLLKFLEPKNFEIN